MKLAIVGAGVAGSYLGNRLQGEGHQDGQGRRGSHDDLRAAVLRADRPGQRQPRIDRRRQPDRIGQQPSDAGLARARWPHHQDALRDAPAELLELLRLLQKLDDLLQLFLRLVHAGHVLERDALLLVVQQLGARLAETESLVAARLHLPEHENPEAEQQQHRPPPREDRPEHPARGRLDLRLRDAQRAVRVLLDGERHQVALDLVALDGCAEGRRLVLRDRDDLRLLDRHLADLAVADLLDQLPVGQLLRAGARLIDDEVIEHHRADQYQHPEN